MPNRLASETSPYLKQHAGNPVDWYPWGEEALARARREDKPILLSIGYSACHWCHVMAHESFEDPSVAEVMNRLFVNIKVDREERPDLDQIYQTAHQMLAGRGGGWPLTMFLSPQGVPFFGGTYYPKAPRHGLPAFAALCERIAELWRERRAEIEAQNAEVLQALGRTQPAGGEPRAGFSPEVVASMVRTLRGHFDPRHGGFGGAPKFPHPADLELCLRRGEPEIARLTLQRMAEGGVFDQLGGGFFRYSVDAQWNIPHFEKMLYDNGPLLGLLAETWLATGEPVLARCAEATAGWLMREMQAPEGGYYASLDADSEGEEGRFYLWHPEEARSLLSREEYDAVARRFGLDGPPNFEGRAWHLRVVGPSSSPQVLEAARRKLLAARESRVRPGRDEKILTAWNGLAIRGMARAARAFGREDWLDSARRALVFIRHSLWRDGRLLACAKDGRASLGAYLDDYAFVLAALLELLQARFEPSDLEFAEALAEALLERFEDPEAGGFFFTAHDHERLIHRPKPGHDQATPSGNGIAAWALGRLAALTGDARYARAAERGLALFYPSMRQYPAGFSTLGLALAEVLEPPKVLVLRGRGEAPRAWADALGREFLPDTLVLGVPDGVAGLPPALDKPRRPEPVNGWLCRGVTCLPPLADLAALREACKAASFG